MGVTGARYIPGMEVVLLTLVAFGLGALPLAWWLGRAVLHVDIRAYGPDHNPGAGNVWRAGGWKVGLAAGVLDVGKATAGVALARIAGLDGWALLPVAVAPLLGHAFTPVLRGRGGKGVATLFGAWIGLSGVLAGGLVLALCYAVFYVAQRVDAWTNVLGVALFLVVLTARGEPAWLLTVAAADLAVLGWTNRRELAVRPGPRRPGWRHRTS